MNTPAEAVSSVAWSSQGVESKLAAVTGSTLAVFSLEHYISSIVQQTPLVQPHPGQTPACQAQHTCPLVALSWTQEGDGLLSADTQGCIIMWRITSTTNGSQQLTQAWIGGNSTVVQPQSILAAGANIMSPSASACPGTKHVTIWWPEELQQGVTEPAVPIPAAKDAGALAMVAIAEQLRHPVGVVVAQWSPGSLQHGKCARLVLLVSCTLGSLSHEHEKGLLKMFIAETVNDSAMSIGRSCCCICATFLSEQWQYCLTKVAWMHPIPVASCLIPSQLCLCT